MCLAEFKGFAQLYCLCCRVRIRNFVFPALVTAFSPGALLGFCVFKLRRVLVRKVLSASPMSRLQSRAWSFACLRRFAQRTKKKGRLINDAIKNESYSQNRF